MKVQLSIDDVIRIFISVGERGYPRSIFDIDFFNSLRKMHKEYGILITLYVFENYGEKYFVSDIPSKYWDELKEASFIKIGFHGTNQESDYHTFSLKCENFYASIPQELWSETIRLHRYAGTKKQVLHLKKYGMKRMLCRENESRKYGDFPLSYFLKEDEEILLDKNFFEKDAVIFQKTDIRIEFYKKEELRKVIQSYIKRDEEKTVFIYTHEHLPECIRNLEMVCEMLTEYKNIEYVF